VALLTLMHVKQCCLCSIKFQFLLMIEALHNELSPDEVLQMLLNESSQSIDHLWPMHLRDEGLRNDRLSLLTIQGVGAATRSCLV